MATKDSISVLGYQQNYTKLNLKLKKENEFNYDLALLLLRAKCIREGFAVKRINKATYAGTKITYRAIEDVEDIKQYVKALEVFLNEFKEKWGL